MDAFELLLRASDPELQPDKDFKEVSASTNGKVTFDYRDHLKNTMLDPIDSIMMLADQACQKSPIRKNVREGAYSPDTIGDRATSDFGEDTRGIGTLLQYGSYFTSGSPFLPSNNRRSRAMSEPWLRHDNWSEEMQFNRNMGADNASSPGLALVAAAAASANGSTIANGRSLFPTFSFGEHRDGRLGMFNAEHRLGYSSLDTSLPHMLDQYAAIYNKNGRIGIYTREERSAIIHRFREKRKRRVWKKKIRYFCRKNLADRRVRVKGRFVKSVASKGIPGSTPSSASSTSGSGDSPTTTTTSTSRAVAGSIAAAAANGRYASRAQAAVAAARARQAVPSTGSEDEEEDEEMEEDEEEDQSSSNMEVVLGDAQQAATAATSSTEEKKPRRLKLVLSSGASSSDSTTTAAANPSAHTVSSAQSTEGKLVFSREAIKKEAAAGEAQDQRSSRTASESDGDDQDGEEEDDVFDSETAGMLRLPTGKRIRRHSIAY